MIEQYIEYLDDFLELITLKNELCQEVSQDKKSLSFEERKNIYKKVLPLLSITKFFAFKEEFIYKLEEKVETQSKPVSKLVFDFRKSKKLIPYMKLILEQSNISIQKKDPVYRVDIINIDSKIPFDMSVEELQELVWKFNKIRDSLAHIHFDIDMDNNIIINNIDTSHKVPDYIVSGTLPLYLLNTSLFNEAKKHEIFDEQTYSAYVEFSKSSFQKEEDFVDKITLIDEDEIKSKIESINISDFQPDYIESLISRSTHLQQLVDNSINKAVANYFGDNDSTPIDDTIQEAEDVLNTFKVQTAAPLDSLYLTALITYANLSLNLFMETVGKNGLSDYYALLNCDYLTNSDINNTCLYSVLEKIHDAENRKPIYVDGEIQGYEKSSLDNFYSNSIKAFERYDQLDERRRNDLDTSLYNYIKDFLSPLKTRANSFISCMRNALDHSSLIFSKDTIYFVNYKNYHEQSDKTIVSVTPNSLRAFISDMNVIRQVYTENLQFDQHKKTTRFLNLLYVCNPLQKVCDEIKYFYTSKNSEFIYEFMRYINDIFSINRFKNIDRIYNSTDELGEQKKVAL